MSFAEGLEHHRRGRLAEAKAIYQRVLESNPDHFDALHLLGVIAGQEGNMARAIELIGRALRVNPGSAAAHFNHGRVLRQAGEAQRALDAFKQAVSLDGNNAEALSSLGLVQQTLGQSDQALASFDRAIQLNPRLAEAHYNKANLLQARLDFDQALTCYDEALSLRPDLAAAWFNRGVALAAILAQEAAVESFERALAVDPSMAQAWCQRGFALRVLGRFSDARDSFDRALALEPGFEFLAGVRLLTQLELCDWKGIETDIRALEEAISSNARAAPPFAVLSITDSPALQRRAAEIYIAARHPPAGLQRTVRIRSSNERIRVGYYSSDFRNHPVSYLTAELFETHDRTRFETFAFSWGPAGMDPMRQRVSAAFDRFIDVGAKSDAQVAALSSELGIEIAVDLGGLTHGSRCGIFAMRAAPVQVSYAGYLGTMGAPYVDYLIADRMLVPDRQTADADFAEKIIWLPSYQANDSKRPEPQAGDSRAAFGLPESRFVFACFNTTYKLGPTIFKSWMRILASTGDSVLVLYASNDTARANLASYASMSGVDPKRLLFAPSLSRQDYFKRMGLVDLFLDTFPYSAGTVGSDALWSGVPLVTMRGRSFASRMGSSLLAAVGLSELVASTTAEYEATAIDLFREPERLKAFKARLEDARGSARLFDTVSFTRAIEAAFIKVVERSRKGLAPEHVTIA